MLATQIGELARRLVRRHPFGQAAQVLDQDHAQCCRQGPGFAKGQLTRFLIGTQKLNQQLFIKGTVGVRHKGPCHAVDAWQADQRLIHQNRQAAKVAARQALVDFAELCLNQVEVIEQPFGRRTDVVAGPGVHPDVLVCLAQHRDVLAQARKKRRPAGSCSAGSVRLAETATVLRETLLTENLGAYRRLQWTACAIQNVTNCR